MDYCNDERPWYIDERDWQSIRDAIGCDPSDPAYIGSPITISLGSPPGNPWWQVERGQISFGIPGPLQRREPPAETSEGSRADVPMLRVFQEPNGLWAVQVGGSIYGSLTEEVARRIYDNERRKGAATGPPPAPSVNIQPALVNDGVLTSEEPPVGIIEDITGAIEGVGEIIGAWDRLTGEPAPVMNYPALVQNATTGVPVVVPPGGGGSGGPPGMYWSPRANCGAGKWIKYRRKRRRLLSESDYNALLRIETLKVNKNMTMAIGKALTR